MESEPREHKIQWVGIAGFYVFFILLGWIWTSFQEDRSSPLFLTQDSPLSLWRDPLLGIGGAALVIALSQGSRLHWDWSRRLEEEFAKILVPLHLPSIAWISLWSSFGEEIFFRGAMQPVLGLTATSLIFGLFHFPIKKALIPWTLMSVLIAFLLGGLFEFTENLLAPILCHFTINFANLCFLQKRSSHQRGGQS